MQLKQTMKKGLKIWLANFLMMFIVIVVGIYVTFAFIDNYTHHGEKIAVPNIENLDEVHMARTLRDVGLNYEIVDSIYVASAYPGAVVDFNPAAGHFVKKGRTVYVTINNQAVPQVTIPDVADNSSLRQATALMEANGFLLTANESVSGQKDWIYAVKYQGKVLKKGAKVPTGATLTLVAGDGDATGLVHRDSTMIDSLNQTVQPVDQKGTNDDEDINWF